MNNARQHPVSVQARAGRRGSLLLLLVTASISWPAMSAVSESSTPQPSGWRQESGALAAPQMLAAGKEIYGTHCQSCHGKEGHGDGPAARFLDPKPSDLTARDWSETSEEPHAAVIQILRDGIEGTDMEPFAELLTQEEIDTVAAFVIDGLGGKDSDS